MMILTYDKPKMKLFLDYRCALDKYLLSNLEYPSDLMAGREAHVYKYADKENMYFNCQISITIKQPGAEYCDVRIAFRQFLPNHGIRGVSQF